ncbi:MAG: hypothetical protein KAG96_05680 [Ichthyobacteriaceae bacterium]|nr:hypothetical protein [Ichthyobacteriaceae bacterium]
MKLLKYIGAAAVLLAMATSCEKDDLNPELTDSDLKVYFRGNGGNAHGTAWEGFDVFIGDTLVVDLMVTPKEGTSVKWVNPETKKTINETLSYSYIPKGEETQKTWFIATRSKEVADTVVFNFRGIFNGAEITTVEADWTLAKCRTENKFTDGYGDYKNLFAGTVNYGCDFEDLAAVMPFELPEIIKGKKIKSAKFQVNVDLVSGAGEYDLYAIAGVRPESTVLQSDHFVGLSADATNSTLIQSKYLSGESVEGSVVTSSATAEIELVKFINDLYSQGGVAGQYIFLRVNASTADLTANDNVQFKGSNISEFAPKLIIAYE